jgi:hypothetical protein
VRLRRGKVGQAPRGRRKPGTAARPDTAVWNGAGFWQSGGCRRVTTATPEWLGWVERPMEAATRDAASVCFASAGRAGGADRIQRNRRADAVDCWWRIGSTGRSRIAHMESRYQSEKQKAVGGHVRQRASIHRRRRRGPLRSPATCSSRMACDCSSRQIPMRQRAPVCVESSVSSGRDRSATVAPSLAPDGQFQSSKSQERRTATGWFQGYRRRNSLAVRNVLLFKAGAQDLTGLVGIGFRRMSTTPQSKQPTRTASVARRRLADPAFAKPL